MIAARLRPTSGSLRCDKQKWPARRRLQQIHIDGKPLSSSREATASSSTEEGRAALPSTLAARGASSGRMGTVGSSRADSLGRRKGHSG